MGGIFCFRHGEEVAFATDIRPCWIVISISAYPSIV